MVVHDFNKISKLSSINASSFTNPLIQYWHLRSWSKRVISCMMRRVQTYSCGRAKLIPGSEKTLNCQNDAMILMKKLQAEK
ncbi:hypothetical protein QYF36_024315 [Acer negundo]|nr:hypothetical protein QYF36_024315 [Acer negundo]